MEAPEFAAHTPSRSNPHWHSLHSHILGDASVPGVTALAERFAAPFGGAVLARYAGLLHDLGKLTPEFQKYLRDCRQADVQKTRPPKRGCAPHKQHGARAALDDLIIGRIGRHAIYTGIRDISEKFQGVAMLQGDGGGHCTPPAEVLRVSSSAIS